jgi:RNA polymerase sigma-70 factor (ECF subfamily)
MAAKPARLTVGSVDPTQGRFDLRDEAGRAMTDHHDGDDLAAVAAGGEGGPGAPPPRPAAEGFPFPPRHGRYADKVFRFAMRHVRCESTAEEIVNEAFLELWRKAADFRGDAAVSTWLLTVARYKAIDRLRRRREEPLDEEAATRIADEGDTPEESLVRADRAAHLRRLIARLSPIHREVVDLVYYQEQSVGQAAQVLGVPEGTVKTRMFAARKQLARLLADAGLGEAFA